MKYSDSCEMTTGSIIQFHQRTFENENEIIIGELQ